MFAYCLNNPINRSDPRGTIPFYDDPLQQAIEDFFQWYWETDENETDENGKYTTSAIIKKTINSFVRNLEVSAGLGVGLGKEFKVLDAGFSLHANYDILAVQYCDEWAWGQRIAASLSTSITRAFEFGGGLDIFKDFDGNASPVMWLIYNNKKESWSLISISDYTWFIGGNVEVSLDLNTFLYEMTAIWEG